MSMNPHASADTRDGVDAAIVGLEGARVITAPSHATGDDVGHHVEVAPDMLDEAVTADVAVTQQGDVAIPEEGSRVIIGYRVNARPIVLGARYGEDDVIPAFEPGERIIGHPTTDSHVHLQNDGTVRVEGDAGNSVELQPDGDVVINDGATHPVTGAAVETTEDADGHVTSVSLSVTRADGVYLPSQ